MYDIWIEMLSNLDKTCINSRILWPSLNVIYCTVHWICKNVYTMLCYRFKRLIYYLTNPALDNNYNSRLQNRTVVASTQIFINFIACLQNTLNFFTFDYLSCLSSIPVAFEL